MALSIRSAERLSILIRIGKLFAVCSAVAAAVLTLSGCGTQNQPRIALQPPTLDSSTPQTQGIFTLVGIQSRTFEDEPFPKDFDGRMQIQVQDTAHPLLYKCVATASNGDRYFLYPQQPEKPGSNPYAQPGVAATPPQPGLVTYYMNFVGPNSWHYLDVDFSDFSGNHARWRLDNIPHFHSLGLTPKASDEHVSVNDVQIDTAAIRSHIAGHAGIWFTQTRFMAPEKSEFSYTITINHRETDPDRYTDTPDLYHRTFSSPAERYELWNELWNGDLPVISYGEISPSVDSYRARQVTGVITKVKVLDEPITFHNIKVFYTTNGRSDPQPNLYVDKPQSVTTPSGLTVNFLMLTPEELENAKSLEDFGYHTPLLPDAGIGEPYSPPQHPLVTYLQSSPLCKQYHQPVTIQYLMIPLTKPGKAVPPPTETYESIKDSITKYSPHATILKDFRVVVRQIVTVQETPFSVTVPFRDDDSPKFVKAANNAVKRNGYGAYAPFNQDPWDTAPYYCFGDSPKHKKDTAGTYYCTGQEASL